MRGKHFAFTLNNYTDQELQQLNEYYEKHDICKYIIFGKEQGENGTPHLQGFVSFTIRKHLSFLRSSISPRAHFETAKGSPRQNRDYCTKEGDYTEFGSVPGGAGTRTDLEAIKKAIQDGKNEEYIRENYFASYLRYERGIRRAIDAAVKPRDWVPEVFVYWGDTGTGKTRKAHEDSGGSAYFHPGSSWFDGYDSHRCVIFDDYGGSEFKLTYLLKLLDRYPMRVPIKGGFKQWVPRKIFITSNRSPDQWYPNAHPEHVAALRRRFTNVIHFQNPFNLAS